MKSEISGLQTCELLSQDAVDIGTVVKIHFQGTTQNESSCFFRMFTP